MNDSEIVMRLKNHEAAALEHAIEIYGGYVAAVVNKVVDVYGTREDKEELCTDAFIALWTHREKLRDNSNLKYWLAVVARNLSTQHLRKLNRTVPLEENQLFEEEADVLEGMEKLEQMKLVRLVVNTLPEVDRDLFIRHYFWRQSITRIAEEVRMNRNTVKSRILRGREKLKVLLIKEGCLL